MIRSPNSTTTPLPTSLQPPAFDLQPQPSPSLRSTPLNIDPFHLHTPYSATMPSNTFANSGLDFTGHSIDNGRLQLLQPLGYGAYGIVYLAIDLHAREPVYLAVKCLLRAGLDSRQRHFQRREIALHQLASRHPNVVTMHKVIEEVDYIFVVMDYCDEGDLFGMITEKQRVSS